MSRNLLYTVQRVCEKLDLDVVNSINDSPDAILIAREAEDTLYDLFTRNEWPERYDATVLESVGNLSNPTALRIPSNVTKIKSLRYDVTETGDANQTYREITKLDPEEFLEYTYSRATSESDVSVITYNGIDIFVLNDTQPTYYTTFDNEHVILDSYNSTLESTLQGSKSVVVAASVPTFVMQDSYIIPLDENTYPLYLAELTAACSLALNGSNDIESERRRNRGISRLRRSAFRTGAPSFKNNYGRNGNGRT